MTSCTECDEKVAKYKCPKCYAKYCSVACCKLHKANTCGLPAKTEEANKASKTDSATKPPRWELPTETEDFVPLEKLARLGDSEEVQSLLKNPHLRAIMENLVNTDKPDRGMEAAMQEPIFVELADQCLRVVEGAGQPDA